MTVFLVGCLPPPVHGMSTANAAVAAELAAEAFPTVCLDMSPRSADRSPLTLAHRSGRALAQWLRFLNSAGRHDTLYMALSGGFGQLYECLFAVTMRLKGGACYIHHHSFAYIDRPGSLTRLLILLAGPEATHVVLSAGMATRLQQAYPEARRVQWVSNAAFLPPATPRATRFGRPLTIGFLGNISAEKGVFEFLDLLVELKTRGVYAVGRLAGPFADSQTERNVRARCGDLPCLEYVGPVYGDQKGEFLASLDVLVFPTKYRNEAEPFVIHEAMRCGVPVIAHARGSIAEIIPANAGLVISSDTPFAPAAAAQIERWLSTPEGFARLAASASQAFASTRSASRTRWTRILHGIPGAAGDRDACRGVA